MLVLALPALLADTVNVDLYRRIFLPVLFYLLLRVDASVRVARLCESFFVLVLRCTLVHVHQSSHIFNRTYL